MAKCPACKKNHGRLAPGDYRCVCAAEFRVESKGNPVNPEIEDDKAAEVGDIFRQTDAGKWIAEAPLDESLFAYIEGTPLEEMHFEYSWRNANIDLWARNARKDDAYYEALQENLEVMSRNTGGKIRVFRGHHVNAPIHGSPNVQYSATSLSPTMAMRFRLASLETGKEPTTMSN